MKSRTDVPCARITLRSITMSILLAIAGSAVADEWTGIRQISAIRFDGTTGNRTIYFETSTGWGAAGCSSAKFAFVRGIEGIKELLAIGMAAKMNERNVSFVGSCQNSDYFQAHYIYVE